MFGNSREPSKISEKLGDFSISLVLGEFFGRPVLGILLVTTFLLGNVCLRGGQRTRRT